MDVTWRIDRAPPEMGCGAMDRRLVVTLSHETSVPYTMASPGCASAEDAFRWRQNMIALLRGQSRGGVVDGIVWTPAVLIPFSRWPKGWPPCWLFSDRLQYITDGASSAEIQRGAPDAPNDLAEDHARAIDARSRISEALGLDSVPVDWSVFADAVVRKITVGGV